MFNCSDQRPVADTKSRTSLHLLLSPTRLLRALTKLPPPPRFDRAITLLAFSLACAAGQIAQAQTIVNICDRTDQVEAALIAHSAVTTTDCAAVTDTMLGNISGRFDLNNKGITSLKANDFAGLSRVPILDLDNNSLNTLPAGVFSGLTALRTLGLLQNNLTTLPEGTFSGLTTELTTLNLLLQNNSGNARMLVYLEQNGNEVTATVPSGAPANLTINLSVSGTAQSGSPTSIPIPVGTTSASVTLEPQSGQTLTAGFDSTPLTHNITSFRGVTIVPVVDPVSDFCGRTAAVQDAIIALVSATQCDTVTNAMLTGITSNLNLENKGITSLKANDFAGLSGITNLDLENNNLTTLPAGVFTDLSSLTTLTLSQNKLATAPPEIFKSLIKLEHLRIRGNEFDILPAGFFAGLPIELGSLVATDQFDDNPDSDGTDRPNATAKITAFLQQVGNEVTVTIPAGAPRNLTANLAVTGATASSPTISIPVGQTSASITLVPAMGQTPVADFASTPVVQTGAFAFSATFVAMKSVPTFTDISVAGLQYFQQIEIDPLQLPQADLSLFQGTAPNLTYSLTAAITDDGNGLAALADNNLPAGLAFDPDTRTLSGTPSAIGIYAMTYSVVDEGSNSASLTFDIQVNVPLDYDALHAQILSHFAITVADSAGQAVSDRIDRMASRQKPRFSTNGSDFEVPLTGQGSTFTLWLQNSATDLSLNGGDFNWSGDVSGTQFGFDWRSDNSDFLVGLMLQNLDGQFDHSGNLPGTESFTGYYSIPMDSEHVYFGWMPGGVQTSNWLNVWGMVGSGSGSLTMTGFSGEAMRSSTDMSMTHLGFSMVPLNSSDWLSLRVRGELTISSLSVDATGGVTGLDVEVTRQRVLVEPTIKDLIASDRHQLVLAGELGFRSDSTSVKGIANPNVGGLPDGAGTELGMKLGYSWRNFDVQVGFRQLSVGADSTGEQYDEDGFYFSLTMGTLFNERGWTASLRPTWGDTGSAADRLWQATQVSDLSANSSSGNSSGSMQAQLSYGMLSPFGSSGLLIPYSQVRTSDSGATNATFGMNLNLNSGWQLHWQYANNTNSNINSGRSASRGASHSASTVQSANDNGGEFKLGAALDF